MILKWKRYSIWRRFCAALRSLENGPNLMNLLSNQTNTIHAVLFNTQDNTVLTPDGPVNFVAADGIVTVETVDADTCRVVPVSPGQTTITVTATYQGVAYSQSESVVVSQAVTPALRLEIGEPQPK